MLLSGRMVQAPDAVGWLIDYAGPMDDALKTAWTVAAPGDHGLKPRALHAGALAVGNSAVGVGEPDSKLTEATRKAILDCVQHATSVSLAEAFDVQTTHAAEFMTSEACRKGRVGADYAKTMLV